MGIKNIDYFKVYNILYKKGYHSKGKNHGQKYVYKLCDVFLDFDRVLEIGCANGMAVGKFLKRRKIAYGIDASMIAVRYAAKSLIPNCIMASATDIPFPDNFVDAIFSCDVLEHLLPKDVDIALDQIKRITKKYLFIVLDPEPERNRSWIDLAKKDIPALFNNIDNLHLTVWSIKRWRQEIEKRGFRFIKKLEDVYCFEKIFHKNM